jgi:haloacetate dehalogenase
VPALGIEIACRIAGNGPPLLMLHGYPQTHVCWHRLAPVLAKSFTVVLPDLPGYGDSGFLEPDPGNRQYSKRHVAVVMAALMQALGHDRFAVVGHDRGARVSYRLALDHPALVSRLVLLDIMPTIETWELFDKNESLAVFHWPFLAQTGGLPERLIASAPDFFLEYLVTRWAGDASLIDARAMAEYQRCFRKESVIGATCADYRAGATVDVEDDEADRKSGRRIACPLLVLWGKGHPDMLPIWRRWAQDVRGEPLSCGHFLAEEAPNDVLKRLLPFLTKS